mgnify:CR=1 FL=1
MFDRRATANERRFDEDLEVAIHGSGNTGAGELAAARFLAAGLAPLQEVPAGLQERAWRRVQARIAAPAEKRRTWPLLWRRSWAVGALGLLVALLATLAAIGPQRVWAQVQRVLGYVPGIGFVNLERSRVLAAPVAVTREGVTLYVEQAIARPGGTTVVVRSEGLPPEDRLWPQGARQEAGAEPTLRLEGGGVLEHKGFRLRFGAGTIEFPPLPEGVHRVTLALPRLPLLPAGAAPEGWEVPLVLRPATGELAAALFPQPYRPEGAASSHQGITLRVLEVAHSPQETALRLALEWQDARWEPFPGIRSIYLRDDLGHIYGEAIQPSSGSSVQTEVIAIQPSGSAPALPPTAYEKTVTFSPLSPLARELTLLVDRIDFTMPAEAAFTLDLGEHPQVGDSWPLDITLQVAGFPVRIVGARLVEEIVSTREGSERRIALEFGVIPGPERDGRALTWLNLDGGAAGFSGAGGHGSAERGRMTATVYLAEGQPIPHGTVRVEVRHARITYRGPWTISWPVPGTDANGTATPTVLHPQVSERHGELTLRLEEAVLSDRLTCLRLALADAPEGVTLSGMDSWAAVAPGQGPALGDDRGRDYGPPNSLGVRWKPSGDTGPDLATLTFAPLQPLARRLTLRLPGVRVAWPGRAEFDVEVPAGVVLEPAGDGRPWRVSAPWAVDIPLEVAGYRLRFVEARLEETNGTTMLVLTSAPFAPPERARRLTGLRLAAVTGPNGRAVDLRPAFSAAGPPGDWRGEQVVSLLFDVAGPTTGQVEPGRYHVALGGVTLAVRRPWELSWDVAGQ